MNHCRKGGLKYPSHFHLVKKYSAKPDLILRMACQLAVFCFLLFVPLMSGAGMRVDGHNLLDSGGELFLIRGLNAMTLYWDGRQSTPDANWDTAGAYTFSQITQTGANTVRIFWDHAEGAAGWRIPPEALDATLRNCVNNNMVPIPELHDITGDRGTLADFEKCVDYWVSDDVVHVLKKYENNLLLNIVNEWNVPGGTNDAICAAYSKAIKRIRQAGLACPVVVDGGREWAADESAVFDNAARLLAADPLHNLVFSIHIYDPIGTARGSRERIKRVMDEAVALKICLIWGEFNRNGYKDQPVDWKFLIDYAQQTHTGYLVWAWWDPTSAFRITNQMKYGDWATPLEWTSGVMRDEPNGILGTSKKTVTLPQMDSGLHSTKLDLPIGPVEIIAKRGGQSLTVLAGKWPAQNEVVSAPSCGAKSQQWEMVVSGDGFYTIRSIATGKVLEVAGGSLAEAAWVCARTDFGRNHQLWCIQRQADGALVLLARHNGFALQDAEGHISVARFSGASEQRFEISTPRKDKRQE